MAALNTALTLILLSRILLTAANKAASEKANRSTPSMCVIEADCVNVADIVAAASTTLSPDTDIVAELAMAAAASAV